MSRPIRALRLAFLAAALTALSGFAINSIRAAFEEPDYTIHVEIDGVDYGIIDAIEGLDLFADDGYPLLNETSYVRVRLTREFVTDPSIYLWAKNHMTPKSGLKDIHLLTTDEDGEIISHQILQLCQPLSWSVESPNPNLGGFNETVDIAVQKITSL